MSRWGVNGGAWRLRVGGWAVGSASGFPSAVDPEPVGGVLEDGGFEGGVHFVDDVGDIAGLSIGQAGRDFFAGLDMPAGEAGAMADGGIEGAIVAEGEDGGGGGGGAGVAEEFAEGSASAAVLIREQPEGPSAFLEGGAEGGGVGAAFEERAVMGLA